MENTTLMFIAGVVIMTASLMLHLLKRRRLEAERKAKRRAAVEASHEAERKRQLQFGKQVKPQTVLTAPDRIPMTPPYDHTFSGTASPRNIAKWEAEIHQIGRQMIGQLDSKMVALQTIAVEANRAANRLELLLEHLERLTQQRVVVSQDDSVVASEVSEKKEVVENSISKRREEENGITHNLIPESDFVFEEFTDILTELESETSQLSMEPDDTLYPSPEPVLPATILKVPDRSLDPFSDETATGRFPEKPSGRALPSSISLSPKNPLLSEQPVRAAETSETEFLKTPTISPLSLSSPRLPGEGSAISTTHDIRLKKAPSISSAASDVRKRQPSSKKSSRLSSGLSIDTLYEEPWSEERPKTESDGDMSSGPRFPSSSGIMNDPLTANRSGSRLALRKQVEMLADYGYTANQIAQNLNITVGEVDLMLSLRN